MSHQLATVVFVLGILGLFLLDRDSKTKTSSALWISVAWLLIAGSRNVGEWLALGQPLEGDSAYLEGNPIDRVVLGGLLLLGIVVLARRKQKTLALLRANGPILWYFLYCGVSAVWSDFPDVSFKRWIRALGDIVVVMLILTDKDWLLALKRVLARVGFVLIPISLLFILHYPELGRVYNRWDGKMSWTGVTTGKNTLGMICMIFALGSIWRLMDWYETQKKGNRRPGTFTAHAVLVGMALLLLFKANSVTSIACLFLAGTVMIVTRFRFMLRRPGLMHALVAVVITGAFCVLFLGIGGGLLQNVGRDSTLTGRTDVWKVAIGLTHNPLLGTGFESFWLGPRLATMRTVFQQHVNQVHNGYLEIYLNLGFVGVALLGTVLVTGYRKIFAAIRQRDIASHLMLAYFIVAIVYDFTEGGFKMMYPVWIFFLLATIAATESPAVKLQAAPQKKATPRRPWVDTPVATTNVHLEEV